MIDQLSIENEELRKLLNIHREQQDPKLVEEGLKLLNEQDKDKSPKKNSLSENSDEKE